MSTLKVVATFYFALRLVVGSQPLIISGGWCFYNQFYNPADTTASVVTYSLPIQPLYGAAAVTINDKSYIFGGWSYIWPNQFRSTVQILDSRTKQVTQGSQMSSARVKHTAVFINDKTYICGGMSNWGVMYHQSSCAAYNHVNDVWTSMPSMPDARVDHTAAAMTNKMYIVGGVVGGQYTNTMIVYDTQTQQWTTGKSMLKKRDVPASIVLPSNPNVMLVCGGYSSDDQSATATCEQYDSDEDTWTTKASMSIERYDFAIVAQNDRIFAIAGMGNASSPHWLGTVEEYNSDSNSWSYIDAKLAAVCTGFVVLG